MTSMARIFLHARSCYAARPCDLVDAVSRAQARGRRTRPDRRRSTLKADVSLPVERIVDEGNEWRTVAGRRFLSRCDPVEDCHDHCSGRSSAAANPDGKNELLGAYSSSPGATDSDMRVGDAWQARTRREEAAWLPTNLPNARRAPQRVLVRRASSESGPLGQTLSGFRRPQYRETRGVDGRHARYR
jgi:hypothetical protein